MHYASNIIRGRVAVVSLIPSAAPFSLSVVKGFLEANCDVCWFTGGFRDCEFADLVPEEVSLFSFGVFSKSRPRRFVDLLKGLIRHGAKLREVDIVIMTWHGPFLIDLLTFLLLRRKLILVEHNVIPHCNEKPRKRDFIRWVLAKKVLVPSSSSRLVFNRVCRFEFLRKKVSVFQHPLIDLSGAEIMDYPRPAPTIGHLAFVGAARGNRGLIQLLSLVASDVDCRLTVFSAGANAVLSEFGNQKELLDRVFAIDAYFGQTEFINILRKPYIFILPYVNSSQSGVLYSLISNDALFICTNTGETGRVLHELGLQELLFELDDPESFNRALNFVINNYRAVREVLHAYRERLANQLKADVASVLGEI